MKNSPPGKFIVLEGLDGSGKSTQLTLLLNRLSQAGYSVASFDFPQHGERSATLVDDYLIGKYGQPKEVSPYIASVFYACDRYDASFKIRGLLKTGQTVLSDRYVASNAAHQGGKISSRPKRRAFFRWLDHLEYGLFQIPRPDLTFILKTSPEFSLKMADSSGIFDQKKLAHRKAYLGEKDQDIHEKNLAHQRATFETYSELAREFPRRFAVIDCVENDQFLAPTAIHERIWNRVQKIL